MVKIKITLIFYFIIQYYWLDLDDIRLQRETLKSGPSLALSLCYYFPSKISKKVKWLEAQLKTKNTISKPFYYPLAKHILMELFAPNQNASYMHWNFKAHTADTNVTAKSIDARNLSFYFFLFNFKIFRSGIDLT